MISFIHQSNKIIALDRKQVDRVLQSIYALRAARAVLLDPRCRESDALVHINEARSAFEFSPVEVGGENSTERGLCGSNLSRPELMDEVDRLHRLAVAVLRQNGLKEPGTVPKTRWLLRSLAWIAPVALLVLSINQPWRSLRDGHWRGQYFPTKNFEGEPIVRWDADLGFDWHREPPMDIIPSDQFSVRWDTCLVLKHKVKVAFQLVSDDGSRLWIDGKSVLSRWKTGPRAAVGKEVDLEAGVHHLRAEYYERTGIAAVFLLASFNGKIPMKIPEKLLRSPTDDLDQEDPCVDVRSGKNSSSK